MSSESLTAIIQSRLNELESQRATMQAEIEKSLMPLNATIAELRSLLARANGGGTQRPPPQKYAVPAAVPSLKGEVVLSPKSKTPVSTNTAVLKKALSGR